MNGGLLVSAIGMALLVSGILAKSKYAPEKWMRTKAVVVNSHPRRLSSQLIVLFIPYIKYSYTVGAHSFNGDAYAYSTSEDRNGLNEVKKMLEAYSVGTHIDIWFRIDSPSTSCIKLSSAYSLSQMHALIAAGAILLILGVALHAFV